MNHIYHYTIRPNDNRLYHHDNKCPEGDWVGIYIINPQDMIVGEEYGIFRNMTFMETKIPVKTRWPRNNIALFLFDKNRL